jgi:hypothetical protein
MMRITVANRHGRRRRTRRLDARNAFQPGDDGEQPQKSASERQQLQMF